LTESIDRTLRSLALHTGSRSSVAWIMRGASMDVKNAVALVTGGASGLGQAAVRELHSNGARVVIVDLPSSGGETFAKELGTGAVFAPADVTSEHEVASAVQAAAQFGDLRVAVNCAGIGNAQRTVGKKGPFPLASFTKIINVNLIG